MYSELVNIQAQLVKMDDELAKVSSSEDNVGRKYAVLSSVKARVDEALGEINALMEAYAQVSAQLPEFDFDNYDNWYVRDY